MDRGLLAVFHLSRGLHLLGSRLRFIKAPDLLKASLHIHAAATAGPTEKSSLLWLGQDSRKGGKPVTLFQDKHRCLSRTVPSSNLVLKLSHLSKFTFG